MSNFKYLLEALIAGRNQWQILLITGSKIKWEYPPSEEWIGECACCQFIRNEPCDKCPLNGYAWKNDCTLSNDSFYDEWLYHQKDINYEEERKYWAGRMVWAFNQAIEHEILRIHDELMDAWEICVDFNESTEFMLQYMQDRANVDLATVIQFLEKVSVKKENG